MKIYFVDVSNGNVLNPSGMQELKYLPRIGEKVAICNSTISEYVVTDVETAIGNTEETYIIMLDAIAVGAHCYARKCVIPAMCAKEIKRIVAEAN